jgi:hypothetical protein
MSELVKPFIEMGFDQAMIHGRGDTEEVTMGDLWGLEHVCQYGRPL